MIRLREYLVRLLMTLAVMIGATQTGVLFACNPEPGPQHFMKIDPKPLPPSLTVGYFEVFNTLNGLPHNSIRSILAGVDFTLVGTDGGGLLVFQGGGWKSLTPTSKPVFPSLTVNALCRTAEGHILAGTPEGLVRVRYEDDTFLVEMMKIGQAPSTNILLLKPVGDKVLIGTDRGAGYLEGTAVTWLKPEPGAIITGVSAGIEAAGTTWFGSSVGLMKAQGEQLFLETSDQQQKHGWVQSLLALSKGYLIGGAKGLFMRDESEERCLMSDIWVSSLYLTAGMNELPGSIPDRRPDVEQLDRLAGLLAQHEKAGPSEALKTYNEQTSWFQNPANWNDPQWEKRCYEMYDKMMQIPELRPELIKIRLPLLKGLWIGTQEDGVLLWSNDGKQRHFTSSNSRLTSNRITAIDGLENGETWIGTQDAGLVRYRSHMFDPTQATQAVYSGKTTVLKLLGERLMVGTEREGLRVYDPVSLECLAHYQPSSVPNFHRRVSGVALDPKGALWVSGDRGVWRFDGSAWQGYDARHGLASDAVRLLEVDADGRVFAVCGSEGMLSEQLYQFDGSRFVGYGKQTVRSFLGMSGKDRSDGLGFLGLQNTYMRSFDLKTASVSLGLYDAENSSDVIDALLATPYYLLFGVSGGKLAIFDGEGFKPVSARGPGMLGRIVFLGRQPGDDLTIVGERQAVTFDGENFKPLPSTSAMGTTLKLLCAAYDDLSPSNIWVGYASGHSGGVALQQGAGWLPLSTPRPVERVAIFEPFVFMATAEGVSRRAKR